MRQRLPIVLSTLALVVALAGVGGPAAAQVVRHALFADNAGKVDGKSAVGSGARVNARKGKLVATSPSSGLLPNNIIAKAPDANLLDGLDSTQFLLSGAQAGGGLTGTYPNPVIGPDAVTNDDLVNGSVTSEKLANGSVTSDKVGQGAVTSDKLADAAVGLHQLAPEVGLGFFTGRVNDLGVGVSFGAPVGLSERTGGFPAVEMLSPDRPIRFREFSAALTAPVGVQALVGIVATDSNGSVVGSLTCNIAAGDTGCTGAGPSAVLPAGSLMFVEFNLGNTPAPTGEAVLFTWRAQAAQ